MEVSNPTNETLDALIQVVDNNNIIITSCVSSPHTPSSSLSLKNNKTTCNITAVRASPQQTNSKEEVQLTTNDWLQKPPSSLVVQIENEESKITIDTERVHDFTSNDDIPTIVDGLNVNKTANILVLHQNAFNDPPNGSTNILPSSFCGFHNSSVTHIGHSSKVDRMPLPSTMSSITNRNGLLIHNANSNGILKTNNGTILNNVGLMNNSYCNTRGPLTFNSTGITIPSPMINVPKKRSRSAPWTVTEMLTLIDAKKEERERCYLYKASGVKLPAAEKWRIVAMHMESKDMGRSGSQCQDKWENMMKDYKAVREWQFVGPLGSPDGAPGSTKNYFKEMTNKERKDASLPPQMDEIVFFSLHAIQNEKEEKRERARRKVSDQYRVRVSEQCISSVHHQQALGLNSNIKMRGAGDTFIKDRVVHPQCFLKDRNDVSHFKEHVHSVDHSTTVRECLRATQDSIMKERVQDGDSHSQKEHLGHELNYNGKEYRCYNPASQEFSSNIMDALGGYQSQRAETAKDLVIHDRDHFVTRNDNQVFNKERVLNNFGMLGKDSEKMIDHCKHDVTKDYQREDHFVKELRDELLMNHRTTCREQDSGEIGLNHNADSTSPTVDGNILQHHKVENSMSIEKLDIDQAHMNGGDLEEFTMDTDSDNGGKTRKKKKSMSSNGVVGGMTDQQDGSGIGPIGLRPSLESPVVLDDFMNAINKEATTLSLKEVIDCFMKVVERNGKHNEADKFRDTSALVQVLVVLADAVKTIAERL